MDLRIEPSPMGGFVVRLDGAEAPVSRHDTEEEAEAWVARFAPGPIPPGQDPPPVRFAALPDGAQLVVRPPAPGEGAGRLVAVDPATGAVAGWLTDEGVTVDNAWADRGVDAMLRAQD